MPCQSFEALETRRKCDCIVSQVLMEFLYRVVALPLVEQKSDAGELPDSIRSISEAVDALLPGASRGSRNPRNNRWHRISVGLTW